MGLAAISPSALKWVCQRIALALPTANRSASYRHEGPASTATITPSRNACDGAAIMVLIRDPIPFESQRRSRTARSTQTDRQQVL